MQFLTFTFLRKVSPAPAAASALCFSKFQFQTRLKGLPSLRRTLHHFVNKFWRNFLAFLSFQCPTVPKFHPTPHQIPRFHRSKRTNHHHNCEHGCCCSEEISGKNLQKCKKMEMPSALSISHCNHLDYTSTHSAREGTNRPTVEDFKSPRSDPY